MDSLRRTVAAPVSLAGVGIHTGQPSSIRVEPAPAGAGLLLRHARAGWPDLRADMATASPEQSDRRTVLLGPQGQRFEQLEHLLAALAAEGISDALLIQDGLEPPFLDGGSLQYAESLAKAGTTALDEAWRPLVVTRPIAVQDGGAHMVATPHDGLRLSVFVEFPGTVVGSAGTSLEVTAESFRREAAPARTFALESDIEKLRAAGLAKGGTLDNAVIFNAERYLNESLRFPDEVVRHKLIDLLGDLALLGRPLRGHFWAWRAGHRSHLVFAQALHEAFG